MELTPEKVRQMLNILLLEAKRQRSNIPYSRVDDLAQAIVVLGPNLEVSSLPVTWRDEREKYAKFKAVSKAAQETFAQAVCLITDVRWVEDKRASEMLGIPPLEEVGIEAFGQNYKRVVTERFGGYLGNAPRGLYSEAIIIIMKGPRLGGPQMLSAPYEEGPNDTIRWLKQPVETKAHNFNLLPDWWC